MNRYLPQEFKSKIKVQAGREGGFAPAVGAKLEGAPLPPKVSRIKVTEYEERCRECNTPLIARIKGRLKPRGFELAKAWGVIELVYGLGEGISITKKI